MPKAIAISYLLAESAYVQTKKGKKIDKHSQCLICLRHSGEEKVFTHRCPGKSIV
jgi:hypothetical protein